MVCQAVNCSMVCDPLQHRQICLEELPQQLLMAPAQQSNCTRWTVPFPQTPAADIMPLPHTRNRAATWPTQKTFSPMIYKAQNDQRVMGSWYPRLGLRESFHIRGVREIPPWVQGDASWGSSKT